MGSVCVYMHTQTSYMQTTHEKYVQTSTYGHAREHTHIHTHTHTYTYKAHTYTSKAYEFFVDKYKHYLSFIRKHTHVHYLQSAMCIENFSYLQKKKAALKRSEMFVDMHVGISSHSNQSHTYIHTHMHADIYTHTLFSTLEESAAAASSMTLSSLKPLAYTYTRTYAGLHHRGKRRSRLQHDSFLTQTDR
jgi:hypothetical protein